MAENEGIPQQAPRSPTAAHRARPRLPTRENQVTPLPVPADLDAHTWRCWGTPDGPGAQRLAAVHQEIKEMKNDAATAAGIMREKLDALTKRSWYQAGGAAVVGLVAMAFLAAWLSGKFAANERNAVKREDVAAAVQQSAAKATAKAIDEAGLFKQMLDEAQVKALPTVTPAKGRK